MSSCSSPCASPRTSSAASCATTSPTRSSTSRGRDEKDRIVRELFAEEGATLVYAATRKNVDRLYEMCRVARVEAWRYHAGLSLEDRDRAQEAFLVDGAARMIATNAFGMGVDRPDIRRVVHYDIPRTVEAYVQETGRAGRDGAPASCHLLFDPADLHVQRFFLESANPSRDVVTDVYRVLREAGEGRHEMTADDIAARMHVECHPAAANAALAILDRAAVVRRRGRQENRALVTVVPTPGDLFSVQPLKPGVGRLLAALEARFGIDRPGRLDVKALADQRGVTPETIRRGLTRLQQMGRIEYEAAFRGRATEVRADTLLEDALDGVDFEHLATKRRHEERKLDQMVSYAHVAECRVSFLLECFGVLDAAPCGRCDRCSRAHRTARQGRDVLGSAHMREATLIVLDAVSRFEERYGFGKLARHLSGSEARDVATGPLSRGPTRGALSHLGKEGSERFLREVHDAGLLRLVPHRLARTRRTVQLVALSPRGRSLLAERAEADS